MKTLITSSPAKAAEYIRANHIVAFPTETVYGLGGNVYSEQALKEIFRAKGRPIDNPLIVHISRFEQIEQIADDVPESAERLINLYFPGPLTVILKRKSTIPAMVAAGLETVGIRMPRDSIGHEFLANCGVPVAAPSANRSGRPSPTTWKAVLTDMDGRIPCLLRGAQAEIGLESTVVDCTGENPLILRSGAISLEEIQTLIPETVLIGAGSQILKRSPGTRYRHYAPHARVHLVESAADTPVEAKNAFIGLETPTSSEKLGLVLVCSSPEQYAYELYDFFRKADALGITEIYCQSISSLGVGMALMDRIRRASQAD